MIIAICILSVGVIFFALLSGLLFYGLTETGGALDELRRYDKDKAEVSNLQAQLIMEKFNFYLNQTEKKLTEEIYQTRKMLKEQGE